MVTQVDLNADIGKSYGNFRVGYDEVLMDYITSASLACGFHAGDPNVMAYDVEIGVRKKVNISAHPRLPDLLGFGRRRIEVTPMELKNYLVY